MPFPLDQKYIQETETDLNVVFPIDFKNRMMKTNGGELKIGEYEIILYPFLDKSDKKRLRRTCNHIGLETINARKWIGFPKNGVAIGNDGFGNQLILIHDDQRVLQDELFIWDHENTALTKLADSINSIEN